jgi:phosphate transport system substrate-binding protein
VKRALIAVLLVVMATRATIAQKLTGAGATFPFPIYSKWFSEYSAAHPGVNIRYRAVGSGTGIREISAGVVDFGASDAPMSDRQLASARTRLIHIPALIGAVVPIYHVSGAGSLRLSGEVLAAIYLGRITNWNDPRIARDNPDAHLPDRRIFVAHRADGSGTSYIFTDYLSKVSTSWASGPGRSSAPVWPTGAGAVHNEGVARLVKGTEGALGYVELIYALKNHLEFAEVKNPAGNWIKASVDGIAEAAADTPAHPRDYRISITNAPGAHAYPISSFTWLLVPERTPGAPKAKLLKDLLIWIVSTGQSEAESLEYAPLPKPIMEQVLATISTLK